MHSHCSNVELLTCNHVEGLFASGWHRSPIKAQLNVGTDENVSVSCWGCIESPASGLKAVIELDTTAEGGREMGSWLHKPHSHTDECSQPHMWIFCPLTVTLLRIYYTLNSYPYLCILCRRFLIGLHFKPNNSQQIINYLPVHLSKYKSVFSLIGL